MDADGGTEEQIRAIKIQFKFARAHKINNKAGKTGREGKEEVTK